MVEYSSPITRPSEILVVKSQLAVLLAVDNFSLHSNPIFYGEVAVGTATLHTQESENTVLILTPLSAPLQVTAFSFIYFVQVDVKTDLTDPEFLGFC